MGSAASHYQDWDAKPCEAINDVDGGTPCEVPRDELEKAKERYDALKREHRKDQAALATAGDALLEELGLAVAFHDAGSWTRVVARKNVPDPVSETHEPHEHMHEPHSPGTWLLRERLRKKHPEGEVGLVEDLVRASNKSHDKRAPQIVVAFCDGTETAHTAYLCAKNLIRPNSKDCLTVATIESDCHGHDAKHQPAAIRHRYVRFQCFCYSIACVSTVEWRVDGVRNAPQRWLDVVGAGPRHHEREGETRLGGPELTGRSSTQETDLTTFLPKKRWQFMHVPRSSVAPSKVVAAFANDRAKMHTAARAHPDPTALCIGFSGRSSKKSDPTVVGQVADMSMRSVFCPIVVCKHAPVNAKKRHFVYIADATDRCIDGMKILDGFLQKDDRLTFLHALTHGSEEGLVRCFREYEKRSNFEFIADDSSTLDVLRERESLVDVDYVCVATRPKKERGSFADALVRHHAGNIIIIKSVS